MKTLTRWLSIGCCFVFLVAAGCGLADSPNSGTELEMTKEEARQRHLSKSDTSTDFCERYGWYGDGICDAWCPKPDPDCEDGSSSCTADSDCASDEFCEKTGDQSCSAQTQGTCTDKTSFCTEEYAPVCGCDGKTYSNDCKARGAGVSIDHDGECGVCTSDADCSAGEFCENGQCTEADCTSNADCGSNEFCEKSGSQSCNAQSPGTCNPRPESCLFYYNPVCGCDGQTYSNDCLAWNAGVNVASEGACQ